MTRTKPLDRLRYAFDNAMAAGPLALIALLGAASVIVILTAGVLISVFRITQLGGEPLTVAEATWLSLTRTLDSGTFGGDTGWLFRLIMLLVTLGGVFIVSTFIGILSSGIEGKIQELRKGRSFVLEQNHTLVLGWSPKVFTIISEITIANENQKRPSIVILSEKDKVEMEDEIRTKVGDTGKTRVICRTGNPIDLDDLAIANPFSARSIVILTPAVDNPDAFVIKCLLALSNHPKRKEMLAARSTKLSNPNTPNIVAEMRDAKNLSTARMASQGEALLLLKDDLVSRITVQTCRQPGLSAVYTELFNFDGDEIYFVDEPKLVGKTFGEALLAYEDSAVIGLRSAAGVTRLNPPMDTRLEAGGQVIAVSRDDDTLKLSNLTKIPIDTSAIRQAQPVPQTPERTLILGWNRMAGTMLRELDQYVSAGSEVLVVVDMEILETSDAKEINLEEDIAAIGASMKHQTVALRKGDTHDHATLEQLEVAGFNHIIVLCYSDHLDVQTADAHTLMTLLHLRAIAEQLNRSLSIVSEMLDSRNRDLAAATRADDFIISDRFTSLILAQLSENKALEPVFQDLFDADGSELYLRPASQYVALDQPLSFYTVVEAARQRGEVALGYRQHAHASDAGKDYGVKVNPVKSAQIAFQAEDRIIVLAED